MNRVEEKFEDPALKQALRRVWREASAPPELRARVTAAMSASAPPASEGVASPGRETRSVHFWSRPLSPWAAAAAVVLVLIGGGIWFYHAVFGPARSGEIHPLHLSDRLVASMIASVDQTTTKGVYDSSLPGPDDLPGLRKAMAEKVHHPVWISDLRKAGWEYKGATSATVAGKEAGEVVFAKGDAMLSIVTLPDPEDAAEYVQDYDATKDNHRLSGFAAGRMLFCVVEYSPKGPVPEDEVKKIRDGYRGEALAMLSPSAVGMTR